MGQFSHGKELEKTALAVAASPEPQLMVGNKEPNVVNPLQ